MRRKQGSRRYVPVSQRRAIHGARIVLRKPPRRLITETVIKKRITVRNWKRRSKPLPQRKITRIRLKLFKLKQPFMTQIPKAKPPRQLPCSDLRIMLAQTLPIPLTVFLRVGSTRGTIRRTQPLTDTRTRTVLLPIRRPIPFLTLLRHAGGGRATHRRQGYLVHREPAPRRTASQPSTPSTAAASFRCHRHRRSNHCGPPNPPIHRPKLSALCEAEKA